MTKVKLADLSAEDKAALIEELETKKRNQANERKKYKELQSEMVVETVGELVSIGKTIKETKQKAFDTLRTLVVQRGEVFDVKDVQKTHSFTNSDGSMKIIMGVREVNSWDGTEAAGVSKIQEFLATKAKDADSATLVNMVTGMLKPDKTGSLDPRRIMELSKAAEEAGNDLFTDGINIIMKAYSMTGTQVFLEAFFKDKNNKWRNISKDFSEIDVDDSWLFKAPAVAGENTSQGQE
jgi:hypothetical protein